MPNSKISRPQRRLFSSYRLLELTCGHYVTRHHSVVMTDRRAFCRECQARFGVVQKEEW